MKAVVWTDVIQSIWMISGLLAVTIYSASNIGYDKIWKAAEDGGRTDFFVGSWDPTVRNSLQAFLLGKTFGLDGYAFCVSQSFVQRYISCKSLTHAKASAYMALPWLALILTLCLTSGFAMLKYYESCDPAAAGFLDTTDQLMPYLTTYLFQDYPGVSAVYVSGAFAGSLSTVSSTLSSMSNVIVNDFLAPYTHHLSERRQLLICKLLVVFIGMCCIGFAYMAEELQGGILEAALSINGIVGGATFAVFALGIFVPLSESIGAMAGLLSGVTVSTWMYIGRNVEEIPTEILEKAQKLEVRYDGCVFENGSSPIINPPDDTVIENTPLLSFYNISVHYIGTLGFVTALVVGFTTSLIIYFYRGRKLNEKQLNPRLHMFLLDTPVGFCIPESFKKLVRCGLEKAPPKKNDAGSIRSRKTISFKDPTEKDTFEDTKITSSDTQDTVESSL